MLQDDLEPWQGLILDSSDYTYYLKSIGDDPANNPFEKYDAMLKRANSPAIQGPTGTGQVLREYSLSCKGRINDREMWADNGLALKEDYLEGRMQICRCYGGREIAVTFRVLNKSPSLDKKLKDAELEAAKPEVVKPKAPAKKLELPKRGGEWLDEHDDFCEYKPKSEQGKPPFPVSLDKACDTIWPLTLDPDLIGPSPSGLLLITGATNSAKSELTRTLIHRLLKSQAKNPTRKRQPHLLTFEDPIEKWLFRDETGLEEVTSKLALDRGVEYTPREKGRDVHSLEQAVDDALRQTPSIFYVGEVRSDEDWKHLLRFAGTGHLVVATAHAGSLIEAMDRVFRSAENDTPAARGQVAQRILGIVHQMKFNLQECEAIKKLGLQDKFEVLLPALWRKTPSGVAALVSDGLSSVLPNNPKDSEDEARTSAFGRMYFANKFIDKKLWLEVLIKQKEQGRIRPPVSSVGHPAGGETAPEGPDFGSLVESLMDEFETRAIRYDLMGV